MTISNKKLIIIKTFYVLFIGSLVVGLLCEFYFVLERRWGFRIVRNFLKSKGIYSARVLAEANIEPLWEIPGKKYKANAFLDKTIGKERYIIKINSHGFRTKEFKTGKTDNVYRIICIGASTTVQGITNDNTYPALLERKLTKKYPNLHFEVLNFGISATYSDHWLNDLEGLFKFQPDLIIQYNAVNDICWRYLSWHKNNCTNKVEYSLRRVINLSFLLQKFFPLDASIFDNCFMQTLQNFKKMSTEARSRGVEYIVGSFAAPDYNRATAPFKGYLNYNVQHIWGRPMNLKYYKTYYDILSRYNTNFYSFVKQNNITAAYVDKYISTPDMFVDICHMTPEGIEKLADTFFESVTKIIDNKISNRNKRET